MTADPVQRLRAVCRQDSDPARRAPLRHSAPPAGPPPAWADRPPCGAPGATDGAPATESDLERLADMADWAARSAARHGGGHARSALAHYLAEDVCRLLTAPSARTLRRGLLTGAAQLTHLLAGMTADVGYAGLARHYHGIGLELAHAAGDRRTYAVTLRGMSAQAHHRGDHRQALLLAESALDVAGPEAPPATRAFLHAGCAVGHAATGHGAAAHEELRKAEHALELSKEPEGPFTSYSYAALQYQRAEVRSLLGNHPGACAVLESSLHERPPGHRRARALIHAQLAHLHVRAERRDAALAECHRFLDSYEQLAAGSLQGRLAQVVRELAPYRGTPGVREFLARLRPAPPEGPEPQRPPVTHRPGGKRPVPGPQAPDPA